jgi:hypothetical protein
LDRWLDDGEEAYSAEKREQLLEEAGESPFSHGQQFDLLFLLLSVNI